MGKDFYFVSDLYFGGDGKLQTCDFRREFVELLGGFVGTASKSCVLRRDRMAHGHPPKIFLYFRLADQCSKIAT